MIPLNLNQEILLVALSIEFYGQVIIVCRPISSLVSYFCNFPEDYSIKCGRLIHLWVAERFIEQKRVKTLEQVAYEYLDELIQMSLVQARRWDLDGRVSI